MHIYLILITTAKESVSRGFMRETYDDTSRYVQCPARKLELTFWQFKQEAWYTEEIIIRIEYDEGLAF